MLPVKKLSDDVNKNSKPKRTVQVVFDFFFDNYAPIYVYNFFMQNCNPLK